MHADPGKGPGAENLRKWDVEGLKKEAGHSSLVINGVC